MAYSGDHSKKARFTANGRASTGSKAATLSLIAILSSISLASVLSSGSNNNVAFAMGDNPASCTNLYNSAITSVKINVGHRTIDLIAHPNAHFSLAKGQTYSVTLTLHSATTSNSGNSDIGSVWYGSTAYGFASDHCVNGVSANSDVTVTLTDVSLATATKGTTQDVELYSWPLSQPSITYTVNWR